VSGVIGQTPARPAHIHAALNNGVECYRKADYESAASYFAQAQAGEAELSMEERGDLATFSRLNGTALKERTDGRNYLRMAEDAANDGRNAEAEALLKVVAGNQFLSLDDKAKIQRLSERLGGVNPMNPATGSNANASNAVMARTKLQQARTMLARSDYAGAEKLAHEVEAMHVTFTEREDSPRKILDEVARSRMPKDPKSLLAASRAALQKGDLDNAQKALNAVPAAERAGELAAIDADSLSFCFDALSRDTDLEGLQLQIEICPRRHRCDPCSETFDVHDYEFACPKCGSMQTKFVSGDELELAYLEVEEHEPIVLAEKSS